MNDMAVQYTQHRFTVEEYHRMGEAGIFASSARIELVDGELIERLVHVNPAHAQADTVAVGEFPDIALHVGDIFS